MQTHTDKVIVMQRTSSHIINTASLKGTITVQMCGEIPTLPTTHTHIRRHRQDTLIGFSLIRELYFTAEPIEDQN